MYRGLTVGVVIPAHDEARLLPVTLAGVPRFVDQIIVVDDASSDGTAEAARRARFDVHVARHRQNRGVGAAIVTGYREALRRGVDVAVVMGADAQMDPDEMPRLLDPIAEGEADYVKGDRLGHPEVRQRMPLVRWLGNHALSWLTCRATGYRGLRDSQCGYTAISRSALARLPLDALYPRYGFPNDVLSHLSVLHARVVDRPVTPIYGDERSGIRIPRVVGPILGILARATVRRLSRSKRPAVPVAATGPHTPASEPVR